MGTNIESCIAFLKILISRVMFPIKLRNKVVQLKMFKILQSGVIVYFIRMDGNDDAIEMMNAE